MFIIIVEWKRLHVLLGLLPPAPGSGGLVRGGDGPWQGAVSKLQKHSGAEQSRIWKHVGKDWFKGHSHH